MSHLGSGKGLSFELPSTLKVNVCKRGGDMLTSKDYRRHIHNI